MTFPSKFDIDTFPLHREFVNNFIDNISTALLGQESSSPWLEVGRQEQDHIKKKFEGKKILTLDMVNTYNPDIVGDLTTKNDNIKQSSFSGIFCMEVLEHAVDPFACIEELLRILEDGGFLVISVPLNARIHGPVPDCWRFTEFGLKILLRNFDIKVFEKLDTPERNLFPLHYAVLAYKNANKSINPRDMKFEYID
jgi:SAM-dependent methyltransferase